MLGEVHQLDAGHIHPRASGHMKLHCCIEDVVVLENDKARVISRAPKIDRMGT